MAPSADRTSQSGERERGDDAETLSARALERLKGERLPPTPKFYTLMYHYYAGSDPDLVAAVEAAAQQGGLIQAGLEELHRRFFGLAEEERAVRETRQELESLMNQLMGALSEAGQETERYADALSTAEQGLSKDKFNPKDLRQLIEMIAQETRQLSERNQALEKQLRDSAARMEALQSSLEEARRASNRDGLTELANRKAFDLALERYIDAAADGAEPTNGQLALLMIDIDDFKTFNDRYGHPIGDEVLKLCGHVITRDLGDNDLAARYGGEEFAVILPGRDPQTARDIAERLRQRMSRKRVRKRATNRDFGQVTLSVGVGFYRPGDTADQLVARADEALYGAKRGGRDQVADEVIAGKAQADAPTS